MFNALSTAAIAALMAIATVISHEIAHYLGAVAMGGQGVRMHWADVTYAPGSLSVAGEVVTWAAGPILTHGLILWVWLSGATSAAMLGLGLGAASRDLLLWPFVVKSLLGRDVSGFYGDEAQLFDLLGISPMVFAIPAALLGVIGLWVCTTRGKHSGGWPMPFALIVGVILGIALWSTIGPVLLPGGRGVG